MSDANAKQQLVDKIKDSTNILVTVSNDPSVDELSAALGLSLLLNKMKKHATAVFSGQIPSAITFLDPERTFEHTVDSLRDFIIALDKEKADHLRYKVEGDVVKIFITPYKTVITSDDLDFSQGDYNVELVLALGVNSQDSLDKALEAHGRIFDDATVATIVAGGDKSSLGSIDWHDQNASSLSEMIVTLSESLKVDKTIDEQIATAFLTGLVAATERFSNSRTSARVMTIAAQLMGAGANQQLVASKFEEAEAEAEEEIDESADDDAAISGVPVEESVEEESVPQNADGTMSLAEGESTKVERADTTEVPEELPPQADSEIQADGTLNISHEKEGTLDEVAHQTAEESRAAAAAAAEAELARHTEQAVADDSSQLPPVVVAPEEPVDSQAGVVEPPKLQGAVSSEVWKKADEPDYGGTLNATTESAAEEKRRLQSDDRNKTILSHSSGYIADQTPTFESPINAASQPSEEERAINPLEDTSSTDVTAKAPPIQPAGGLTLMDIDNQHRMSVPPVPSLPPMPDFSTLPPLPSVPGVAAPNDTNSEHAKLGDILPPADQAVAAPPAGEADPGQFKIPGQS